MTDRPAFPGETLVVFAVKLLLALLIAALFGLAVAACWVRVRARLRRRPRLGLDAVDTVELALLAGGPARAVATCLVMLY
nr:hypothetical protein [Micromonospora sp. DSM 115978]